MEEDKSWLVETDGDFGDSSKNPQLSFSVFDRK